MTYIPPNPNGQALKTASTPVVLASDQNNAIETGGNLATIATNLPAKGLAQPTASLPATLPVLSTTGTAQSAPALNYEFLTNSTSGWYDALGYNSISFNIVTGAGISAGVIAFEQTNDTTNANAGVALSAQDSAASSYSRFSSLTLVASTTRQFEAPIAGRYIRFRVSSAVVGGTVLISSTLRQSPTFLATHSVAVTASLPAGTNIIGAAYTATTVVTDIASAALTTTSTSSAVGQTNLHGGSFNVAVTAVSGTSPTLDVVIQESLDGVTYFDLYHFERITAVGNYISPTLRITGQYIRYVRTVGGTSPSFTNSVVRNSKSSSVSNLHSFYDRALVSTQAVNSTTASFFVQGTSQIQMTIASGTATTACAIQIQGSIDNANWYAIGSATTAMPSTTVVSSISNHAAKYIRGIVTTAGVGQTLTYVNFVAQATS